MEDSLGSLSSVYSGIVGPDIRNMTLKLQDTDKCTNDLKYNPVHLAQLIDRIRTLSNFLETDPIQNHVERFEIRHQ